VIDTRRPWSAVEIEERVPELIERLEAAVAELRALGIRKSQTEWAYRRARSTALLSVKGPNADHREAAALLHQVRPNVTVADLGLERDLAEAAYATQRTVISALQTDADLLRTLMVTARNEGQR
jgi:hypothetical protein